MNSCTADRLVVKLDFTRLDRTITFQFEAVEALNIAALVADYKVGLCAVFLVSEAKIASWCRVTEDFATDEPRFLSIQTGQLLRILKQGQRKGLLVVQNEGAVSHSISSHRGGREGLGRLS